MSETDAATRTDTATTTIFEATDGAATTHVPGTSPARPTVRWGALVWSLIFGAVAATTLWVVVDRDRRDAVDVWLLDLTPLAATLYLLLALGALIAVFGLVALIRRGERARV
ncbi:hypothetical protein [Agromyces bauzanensis]